MVAATLPERIMQGRDISWRRAAEIGLVNFHPNAGDSDRGKDLGLH